MLYFKTVQSNAFKCLFEVLKEILHDVSIQFDAETMRIMTVDGSHVALVHLRLDAKNFEEYVCTTPMHVGVNMLNLYKLLKVAGNNDTISFSIADSDASELAIKIENNERRSQTEFKLKLLDVDIEELNMPDIEFDSIITLPSAYFQRMCKDMNNISELMTIRSRQSELVLSCTGDFASQETCIRDSADETGNGGGPMFQAKSDEVVEGTYMLKYLILFNKSSSLSNTMEIYMRKDYPLIMKYQVANLGELRFCLASKIEESAQGAVVGA
jgi:proliferating cell nuclear antigen